MTLRTKTILIISLTLVGLIAILYATSQIILLSSFTQLEEQAASQNIERALSALSREFVALSTTTEDYAAWDDTYAFIIDGNRDYIEANLTDLTLADLRFNLVLFINTSNQIVFSKGFDLENNRAVPIPASLWEHLSTDSPLLQHPTTTSSLVGLVLLPENPLLIASQPILTNESEGPIRGTLIFGRYLSSTEIERLAEITHLSLMLYRFDDRQLPSDFQVAQSALSVETPFLSGHWMPKLWPDTRYSPTSISNRLFC